MTLAEGQYILGVFDAIVREPSCSRCLSLVREKLASAIEVMVLAEEGDERAPGNYPLTFR
jgi:hypothetical protein